MDETAGVLLDLFAIFAIAKIAGEGFRRTGQPAVLGELLAGVVIGPHALGIIDVPLGESGEGLSTFYEILAELGLVVLLFSVGLETGLDELLRVGRRALAIAVVGVALPFGLGAGYMAATGSATAEALFVGAAMSATSVAITARVLRDLGILDSTEANIILGAAVLDDVLALLLLTAVVQFGEGSSVDGVEIAVTAVVAVVFLAFTIVVGSRAVRRYSLHLERLPAPGPLVAALMLMLGLSAAAGEIGLAGIVGAFVAGLMLGESREQLRLEHQVQPIYEFLTPFFFVITGAKVDLGAALDGEVLLLALALAALAIAGKMIAGAAGSYGLGLRSMAITGTGMVPHGEIGLVVASIGLAQGSTGNDVFSAIVFMILATAIIVPPVLRVLVQRSPT